MSKNLLIIFLFVFSFSYSQEKYEDSIKKIIEKDFALIKPQDFKYLVPFNAETGMGYLNSKTNKVVVKPTYYSLDFFKPNLKAYYKDFMYFEIDHKTKEITVSWNNVGLTQDDPDPDTKDNSEKGFTIQNNLIYSYSNIYSYRPQLFKYKNDPLAIATIAKKMAIINAKGETLKNLDFNYSNLEIIDIGNDNIWFKYKTLDNKEGFISINGEKSLVNNIISNSNSKTSQFYTLKDTYNGTKGNYYGYSIESSDKLWGVLDLITMTWVIKPQKTFKIDEINYSTDYDLQQKPNLADRNKLKFYFLVHDGIEYYQSDQYYIDEKFKKYVLKK